MGTDWTYTIKYDPKRFGKPTFRNRRTLARAINVMNVGVLGDAMTMLIRKGLAEEKEGKTYVDLEKMGYHKLLGAGKISLPIVVQVAAFSEVAKRKIEGAGGAVIVKE
jgi:large subunit ribosomal protein L15